MSTITREFTKEQLQQIIETDHVQCGEASALARIALASLEAEPVAWLLSGGGAKNNVSFDSGNAYADPLREVTPLYTAPPAPVALTSGYSDFEEIWSSSTHPLTQDDEMKDFAWDIWNACRAAMLQGADVSLKHEGKNHTEQYLDMVDHSGDANENVDCRLTFDQWLSQQNEPIDVDCGCVSTEAFYHWLRVAYEAGNSPVIPECSCRTCRPVTISDMRFVVCPECGNKRCPHANDHRNACTGSNEPGREGSAYPAAPQQEVK